MCQLCNIDDEKMNKPTEKQIEEVLAGVATPEVARVVAQWFATDEGSAYLAECMERDTEHIKFGLEDLYVDHKIDSDKILARILQNIHRKRIRRILFRVAAVLFPVAVLLGLFFQVESRIDLLGDSGYEEIYVPKGDRVQMIFQDGTRVYINSDSRLKYPKKFGLNTREVYLQGEAYFVVSKNKRRPFIVNLDGPAIHVLGTSFDVCDYEEDGKMFTTLEEGVVEMEKADNSEQMRMAPGEQVCLVEGGRMRKYEVETALFTSWRSGRLVFKNMSLEDLMRNITRWYDVEVKFERESLKKVVFTGDMKKYEDLSDVLEFIELTSETHFLIEGNKIIVY